MKKEIICKKQLISVLGSTKWTTGKDVECEYCPHCGSPHIIVYNEGVFKNHWICSDCGSRGQVDSSAASDKEE